MCIETKKSRLSCRILENKQIAKGIYKMVFFAPEIASETLPGQFVNMYCQSESNLLPRPISICETNKEQGLVTVVYAIVGRGTNAFSKAVKGDVIDVLGPLGKGFPIGDHDSSIIVGGGVGVPPLLELVKTLEGKKDIYLGFRAEPYLVEDFRQFGNVFIATEDGSFGHKGNVIELMHKNNADGNVVFSCGPKPMLEAVKKWSMEQEILAWLSLEERMGCGFGACVGCVCKIYADNETGYTYKKVCKNGPVFNAKEVLFE